MKFSQSQRRLLHLLRDGQPQRLHRNTFQIRNLFERLDLLERVQLGRWYMWRLTPRGRQMVSLLGYYDEQLSLFPESPP